MRPIKFRAWDKENKQMSWPFTLYDTPTWEAHDGGYTLLDEDFAQAPIMQFTGLLDKNGKEIYEGDLIKIPATTLPKNEGGYVQAESIRAVGWSIRIDGIYDENTNVGFCFHTGNENLPERNRGL